MTFLAKLIFSSSVVAAAMAIAPINASADDRVSIYRTGFERLPFVAGQPLVGQDGWVGVGILSPDAAVIATSKAKDGKQSVLVRGADLVHQEFVNQATAGYYDAIGSFRKPLDFDTQGRRTVRVSVRTRLDGPRTTSGVNFFSASVGARARTVDGESVNSIAELALSSDGHAYAHSGNENVPGCALVPCIPPATFLASTPVDLKEWHDLAFEANFLKGQTTFFVDGECLGSFPILPVEETILLRGFFVVYAAPDSGNRKKADYQARYDTYSVKAIT